MAPTVRSFSAEFEPLRLIARWPEIYPALLESGTALGARLAAGGRFDILPMSSRERLELDARRRLSGPHAGAGGFLAALQSWWSSLETPRPTGAVPMEGLPFSGGWILYLGYELAAEIEPSLMLPPCPDPFIAFALRAPAAWIRDRATGRAWLVAEPEACSLLDDFERHVRELAAQPHRPCPSATLLSPCEEPAERFLHAVSRALDYIGAGEVYQANLSRRWQVLADVPIHPTVIQQRLRAANPGPFAGMIRYGDFALMSSSPERLLSIVDGRIATRPIAGTRPRGATPADDAALAAALLADDKERAEHVMLIDLERNDLGRVCVGGSIRVDEYMAVETYAHVHHIVSNVSGRLRPQVSPVEAMRALFPGGTITGCPKVRCMQIIAELEGSGRGAYTGSMGYLNRDGSCDLNILIRTLTAQGDAARRGDGCVDSLTFRAGAGIVADSDPERELAETRAKAKGLLRALDPHS